MGDSAAHVRARLKEITGVEESAGEVFQHMGRDEPTAETEESDDVLPPPAAARPGSPAKADTEPAEGERPTEPRPQTDHAQPTPARRPKDAAGADAEEGATWYVVHLSMMPSMG